MVLGTVEFFGERESRVSRSGSRLMFQVWPELPPPRAELLCGLLSVPVY